MADAKRDGNYVTTLLAVSSIDGVTPVTLYADPNTHRLLVDSNGFTTVTGQYKSFVTVGSSNADYVTDGVDDNVQIQQAIDDMATLGGGIVFIKSGTYNITTTTITGVSNFACGLRARSNVTIFGANKSNTILLFSGTASRADGVDIGYISASGTTATITNFKISNLTLDGNSISLSSFGSAIRAHAAVDFNNLEFTDLIIQNWAMMGGIGIGLSGNGASKYVTTKNIYGTNIKRAVVWFASVDYLTIDQTIGENLVGDSSTDEGGVVQVESGKHPIISNTTGINTPYQTLLLGGTTRGIVRGVRGTFNLDGIYVTGSDWHISDVRLEVGSSPAATTYGIRYDKTNTPGQPHASPVENTNYYLQFSDIWIAGSNYGLYFNASVTNPSNNFQFDRVRLEGTTTAAVKLVYCNNFTFEEFQTLSNTAVFQLSNSTVQVLSGNSSESSGAYINSVINSSTLNIQNISGQTNTQDVTVVHVTGNEIIGGNKTFSVTTITNGLSNTGTITSTGAITSNDKVRINTGTALLDLQTTQSGNKEFLVAVGLLNTNSFSIYDQTIGAYRLHIDTNGNVGFGGITSPSAVVDTPASTTTNSGFRIRSGTAPTSPNDGDIWFDGSSLKIRISGVTKTFTVT